MHHTPWHAMIAMIAYCRTCWDEDPVIRVGLRVVVPAVKAIAAGAAGCGTWQGDFQCVQVLMGSTRLETARQRTDK